MLKPADLGVPLVSELTAWHVPDTEERSAPNSATYRRCKECKFPNLRTRPIQAREPAVGRRARTTDGAAATCESYGQGQNDIRAPPYFL